MKWEAKSIKDVIKELGLPEHSKLMGYVIHREDTEEFLAKWKEDFAVIATAWAKTPELALVYKHPSEAESVIELIEKNCIIGALWDVGKQYRVSFEQ